MIILRDYQSLSIETLRRSILGGAKRPILQLPTGGGKTHIAAALIQGAVAKRKKVLFLAPRRELIYQASEKLSAYGVPHGIIMAGEPPARWEDVQVASFDTLHSRAIRNNRIELPPADLVIVDEAHLSIANTKQQIIGSYPEAIVVGLTATPARGDGRGMGEIYDDLIVTFSISDLTDRGFLSPVRYFAPSKPDLEGIKKGKDGDYLISALGERVDKAELIGDVVRNWQRIASDRQTVVFCVNRAHSRHIRDRFLEAGYRAEHLDGETPLEERKDILRRIATGETQILCNVFVATFGLDIPSLSCAVLARPTKNISLYLQTCGRVLRTHEGKDDAIIIDHSGAIEEHGFLDDFIPWSLDESRVQDRKRKQERERKEPKEIICGDCGAAFKGTRQCPECGSEMIPPSKPIPTHQADLKELQREHNREWTPARRREFYAGLLGYAKSKGYLEGWAAHKYKERIGKWPKFKGGVQAQPPSQDVLNWVKYLAIRAAKSRVA